MNSKAEFYLRSFCDGDIDGHTESGDLLSPGNMLDRNKNTFASTTGSNDDTVTVTEEFDLGWKRDIDTFVLRSNLRQFDIQYWDGSAWQAFSPAVSYVANTEIFLLINLAFSVSTSKIKLTMTKTIAADEEKKVSQFEVTEKITDMYIETAEVSQSWQNKKLHNIYGGSILVTQYPNHGKINIGLKFKNLTGSDYTAYKLLKDRILIDSYSVYVYLSDTYELLGEDAYYLVNDHADFDSTPASTALTAGIDGKLDLREA